MTKVGITIYDKEHRTFAGEIYQYDFCTDHAGSRNIAARVASSWNFNENCRKQSMFRDLRNEENKNEK